MSGTTTIRDRQRVDATTLPGAIDRVADGDPYRGALLFAAVPSDVAWRDFAVWQRQGAQRLPPAAGLPKRLPPSGWATCCCGPA